MKRDWSGERINAITIVSFSHKDGKNYFWNCRCDCGKEFVIRGHNLYKNPKSCGCLRGRGIWKGFEDISLSYFSQIKNNALRRNIQCNITIEDIWQLFIKQNRKCALSGVDLNFARRYGDEDQTASLDRIDSNKPYSINNLMWVHKDLNMMRSKVTLDEFKKWCNLVTNYERRNFNCCPKVVD